MIYLLVSIVIIIINVVPAFMPPTWTVVSFAYINWNLNLFILAFIAACSSGMGRILLFLLSEKTSDRILSKHAETNMTYLGNLFKNYPHRLFIISFVWSLMPIGSNPLFIAAGLAQTKLKPVITGFFCGRLISYTYLAYTSKAISIEFKKIFVSGFTDWRSIITTILLGLTVSLFIAVDWKELIEHKKIKFNFLLFK